MDDQAVTSDPSGQSITRKTLTNFLWMLSGSGVETILRIVSVAVMARLLTPEEFGVMGAATVVVGLANLFSQLGMGPALVQRSDLEERHLRTAFTVSLMLSGFLAVGVYLSAGFIADFFGFDTLDSVLRVVALLFPIAGLGVVASSLLARNLKFRVVAGISAGSYAIGYVVFGIILAAAGFGVWSLVFAQLARALLLTGANLALQPHPKRLLIDRSAFRDLMTFGGGFTLARLFNYTALQGDYVVAGRWLGAVSLGLYTRAYQLLVFPVNLIASVIDTVLFPSMAKVQDEVARLEVAYRRGETVIALAFIPLTVFAVVLAPEIIMIALGPQWTAVVGPFQILAAGMFFRAGYKISDSLARATGAVYRRAWRQGVYALAVLVGAYVGQDYGGLNGLAFGVLAALAINFTLMNHLSLSLVGLTWGRFLSFHWPGIKVGGLTLIGIFSAAAPLRAIGSPDIVVFAVALVMMILAFVIPALARPEFLGADGMWVIRTFRQMLRRRRRDKRASTSGSA